MPPASWQYSSSTALTSKPSSLALEAAAWLRQRRQAVRRMEMAAALQQQLGDGTHDSTR
jgi:hypothetical protein